MPRHLPLTAEASAEAGAASADRARAGVCVDAPAETPGPDAGRGPRSLPPTTDSAAGEPAAPDMGRGTRSGGTGGEVEGLDVLAGCLGSDF